MILFRFFSVLALLAPSGLAHAHVGHIGELAGHGHLIGLGALLGAAALAAALRKPRNTADSENDEDEAEDLSAEGEAA